jgi:UDP-N-acetyl-2-amino-2-deoxyglucuronate dehydrogenase
MGSRDRLRTAIAGCGKVASTHAQAWQHLPDSQFVSVCDINPERAAAMAAQFGVRPYTNLAEMLEREQVSVLSVATPHPLHVETIETAASRGVHVICEKPLAVEVEGCQRAILAARRASVKLGVISQRRFYEPVQRMRKAIDAGKIGRPILCEVMVFGWRDEAYYRSDPWRGTWAHEGGGVMVNQCPHQLDLMLWFMGPIAELHGYHDNFNHSYIEVEDTAAALIRFRSGAIGTLVLSNSQNPGLWGKVHVHGSSGATVGVQVEGSKQFISGMTSEVDPPFNDVWTVPEEAALLEAWQKEDRSLPWDVMTHYHARQFEDFLGAVLENRKPAVTGEDGLAVVELFNAVYVSQREHRTVSFPLIQNSERSRS